MLSSLWGLITVPGKTTFNDGTALARDTKNTMLLGLVPEAAQTIKATSELSQCYWVERVVDRGETPTWRGRSRLVRASVQLGSLVDCGGRCALRAGRRGSWPRQPPGSLRWARRARTQRPPSRRLE